MKTKYTFNVHTYAPELNRVYANGVDISDKFDESVKKSLTKSHAENLRIVRKALNKVVYNHYIEILYFGEKSGFARSAKGGFNSWADAMDALRPLKSWFTTEKPNRSVSFLYYKK